MFGKGRKQDQAAAAQEPQGSGEYTATVTDTNGHTTQYIGCTAKQRDAILRQARHDQAAADFLARWRD